MQVFIEKRIPIIRKSLMNHDQFFFFFFFHSFILHFHTYWQYLFFTCLSSLFHLTWLYLFFLIVHLYSSVPPGSIFFFYSFVSTFPPPPDGIVIAAVHQQIFLEKCKYTGRMKGVHAEGKKV